MTTAFWKQLFEIAVWTQKALFENVILINFLGKA